MKKKNLLVLTMGSAFAMSLTVVGSHFASNPSLMNFATGSEQISCAHILFGSSQYSGNTEVSAGSFTTSGITVSSISSTKVYYDGSESAARVGSSSAGGTITFNFDQAYYIKRVKILAYQYNSNSTTYTYKDTNNSCTFTVSNSSAFDDLGNAADEDCHVKYLDYSTAVSSFTITSTKRFNLSKIVLTLAGSGGSSSSSESSQSSSSVSQTTSGSYSTLAYETVANNAWPTAEKTYRVVPNTTSASSVTVYNVKYTTTGYLAYPTDLTLVKDETNCLTYETVALYYQSFGEFPPNYTTTRSQCTSGSVYRLVSTYTKGSYSGSNDYTTSLGTFRNSSGKYYELDIAVEDGYSGGTSYGGSGRGAGRLVIVADGISEYSDASPVCYFTMDHYSHFSEFYNYATGWSPVFDGTGSGYGDRSTPSTVTATYLS